jgi:hypothetical protein
MSVRLDAYLDLERAMLALDDAGDQMADALRDALDPIWYALSDDDRAFLNQRSIASGPVYYVRVAVDAGLFTPVSAPAPRTNQPTAPVHIDDWMCAA